MAEEGSKLVTVRSEASKLDLELKRAIINRIVSKGDDDKVAQKLMAFYDRHWPKRRPAKSKPKAKPEAPAEPPKPKQDTSFMD